MSLRLPGVGSRLVRFRTSACEGGRALSRVHRFALKSVAGKQFNWPTALPIHALEDLICPGTLSTLDRVWARLVARNPC